MPRSKSNDDKVVELFHAVTKEEGDRLLKLSRSIHAVRHGKPRKRKVNSKPSSSVSAGLLEATKKVYEESHKGIETFNAKVVTESLKTDQEHQEYMKEQEVS